MEEIEKELLQATLNCYNACHDSFENTIEMISKSRGLEPNYTKEVLKKVREKYDNSEEYKTIRAKLPKNFDM